MITKSSETKIVPGSVYQGDYVLREMRASDSNPGYFVEIFERV
jgi:hypothetical protein